MKNTKKLPTKQLEKFSTVFTQLGLVLVLFIVYVTLEYQTEIITTSPKKMSSTSERVYLPDEQMVIISREPKEIIKVKVPEPEVFIIDEPIKKGENETIIFKKSVIEDPVILEEGDIIIADEDPEIEEDVPFINIEEAPVFKGCEGLSKEDNKICFEKMIKKFVQQNFDGELAQEIGLHTGKHKIHTQFIIDKNGDVIDIKIRAPHPRLKKEVDRVINKLPKFTPGKQRKKPVKVRYTLPIAFSVD